jgi:ferritin-like metal-binding protein YciE
MVDNLEEAFLSELGDMLYAERELTKVLPKLAQSTNSRKLRDFLEWQIDQSHEQVMRLEKIFKLFGHKEEVEVCEGMQGILAECKDLLQKTGPGPVRDALIIAAVQKADHYEIASYGTLCSWADELEEDQAVRVLEETLYEKKAADRTLTRIAESRSNPDAERGAVGRERGFDDSRRSTGDQGEWRENETRTDDRSRGRGGREKRYND